MRQIKITLIFFLLLFIYKEKPPTAVACTQPPEPLPSRIPLSERINQADLLLIGTVAEEVGSFSTMQIDQISYLKGSGPNQLAVTGFGTAGLCAPAPIIGKSYILLLKYSPDRKQAPLSIINFGFSSPSLLSDTPENRLFIEEALQLAQGGVNTPEATFSIPYSFQLHPDHTPQAPTTDRLLPETSNKSLIILLLLVTIMIIFFFYKRN